MAVTRETLAARVRSLLEARGVRHRELAATLGIDPSGLSRALKGERTFKSMEIAQIAQSLSVPVEVLLAEEPIEPPQVRIAARRQPDVPSAVDQALERAETFLSVSALLPADDHFDNWRAKLQWQASGTAWQQGLDLGRAARENFLPAEPLPAGLSELAQALEQYMGIDVAMQVLDDGLDGLSLATSHLNLALISTSTAPTRQRWTLAHEVGHLLAGDAQEARIDENLFAGKQHDEVRANSFAATFLAPESHLKEFVGGRPIDEMVVRELLDSLGISLDALAFRLHNVGLVDASGRDRVRGYWMTLLSRDSTANERQGSRLPGRLLKRAVEAYATGDLGVRPLASLLDVQPDELLAQLQPDVEEAGALEGED